jgi:hypothetical protein
MSTYIRNDEEFEKMTEERKPEIEKMVAERRKIMSDEQYLEISKILFGTGRSLV